MKVLLVQPAWGQGRHFHMFEGTPPLGLAYVAAVLLEAGHDVSVLDAVVAGWENIMPYGPMLARGLSNDAVVSRVAPGTEVVGISVISTTDWPLVIDLCERLKRAFPNLWIVLGGEHPTAIPKFCLETSCADVVVLGEGEETIVELLPVLTRGGVPNELQRVRGIAFRDAGTVVETEPRARIRDLESLPRPAWHLFDIDRYQSLNFVGGALWLGRRSLPMLASRGCPYQCTFCTSPSMWGTLWVPREPKAIVDEMEFYREQYGVTDLSLHDLTTVVRRSWVEALCDELIARKLGVSWQLHSGTRLEEVDTALVRKMREAGLAYIVLAPESISAETRKRTKKRMEEEDIYRAIHAVVQERMPLKVQVMSGLPGDGHADAMANVRFAAELGWLGVDAIGTAVFAPYPGTELFDELLASGALALGDELLFFPVANNDFVQPIVRSQKLSTREVKAYQFMMLGAFIGAKFVRHPIEGAGSLYRALFQREEKRFFDKMLRAILTAVYRSMRSPFTGEAVTWTPIDYARFTPEDLQRKRRMNIAKVSEEPREPRRLPVVE